MVTYANFDDFGSLSSDDRAAVERLGRNAFDAIVRCAEADARIYAADYPGQRVDPSQDWDSQAWEQSERTLLTPPQRAALEAAREIARHDIGWAIYSEHLYRGVDRAVDAA